MSETNDDLIVIPKYQSDVYYKVVIENKEFKGWRAPDVGLGRMRFVHPKHGAFTINKGMSNNWMQECWDDFIKFVAELEA